MPDEDVLDTLSDEEFDALVRSLSASTVERCPGCSCPLTPGCTFCPDCRWLAVGWEEED